MTPNDVKELLKKIIAEEGLPLDLVDMPPDEEHTASSSLTTKNRVQDVANQWKNASKLHTRQPWRSDLMKFYSKTDAESATKELLESFEVEALLETIISEQNLLIRFIDHGFRLITLQEDDTSRYPVKILHGGFRLEKSQETRAQHSQLEIVAKHFESILMKKNTKAKLIHRGFRLEKNSEANIPISQVEEIAKRIDDTLGINYRLDSWRSPRSAPRTEDVFGSTKWSSANIRISLWRFPRYPRP